MFNLTQQSTTSLSDFSPAKERLPQPTPREFRHALSTRLGVSYLGPVTSFSMVVCGVLFSLLTLFLVDWMSLSGSLPVLNVGAALLVSCALTGFLAAALRHFIYNLESRRLHAILMELMYAEASPSSYQGRTGTIETCTSEIIAFYKSGHFTLLWEAAFVLIQAAILFMIEPTLAAVVVSALPVFILLSFVGYRNELSTKNKELLKQPDPSYGQFYAFVKNLSFRLQAQFLRDSQAQTITLLSQFLRFSVLGLVVYLSSRLVIFDPALQSASLFGSALTAGTMAAVLVSSYFLLSVYSRLPALFSQLARTEMAIIEMTDLQVEEQQSYANPLPANDPEPRLKSLYTDSKSKTASHSLQTPAQAEG